MYRMRASFPVVGFALMVSAVLLAPAERLRAAPPVTAPTMVLVADERKVVGWISSGDDLSGSKVRVAAGEEGTDAVVQEGNTFVWYYKVAAPMDVTFSAGKITQTIHVQPRVPAEPSVFFVVDRTVYRPTQTLYFAAFLRTMDEAGRFTPIANRAVEAEIRSQTKKTLAAKLSLTSDDAGKIVGSYTFSTVDPLDAYTLAIPGFRGSATISHAEYRKSKIKLKITGELKNDELHIKFSALDFLDKTVSGSKVTFQAQVVRNVAGTKKADTLNPQDFVYAQPASAAIAAALDPFDRMEDEERLLMLANTGYLPMMGYRGPQILAAVNKQIDLAGAGEAEHILPIPREWQTGDTTVMVQGVLVDQNGREQRATEKISLAKKVDAATQPAAARLQLSLPGEMFEVDEAIPLAVKVLGPDGKPIPAVASAVAMHLTGTTSAASVGYGRYPYATNAYHGDFEWQGEIPAQASYSHLAYRNAAYIRPSLVAAAPTLKIDREMETAAVVEDGLAEFKFAKQGAYKLVVVAKLPGGRTVRDEIGCVVRERADLPGIQLSLDRDQYTAGQAITAKVNSRCADRPVLFVIRDSVGVRVWKTLQLKGTSLEFTQTLPDNLHYGVSVDVQCVDDAGESHIASQMIHVTPDDRILNVTAKTPELAQPGETVKVDIDVNRREAVDLIVSVYDQSLLGISPDRLVDIRSFYLADDRVRDVLTRDQVRRRIGSVTIEQLVDRAKELLKDAAIARDPVRSQPLTYLVANYNNHCIYGYDVATLLRLAGINAQALAGYSGNNWRLQFDPKDNGQHLLVDAMEMPLAQYRLVGRFLANDTLVLVEYHPSYDAYVAQYGYLPYAYRRYAYPGAMSEDSAGFRARGDAAYSSSANGSLSFLPEGQAVYSQLPAGQAIEPIVPDGDQGGMAVRRDFSDSAYWNAAVRTDDNGKATVAFKLPDSLTNWQVVVTAVSKDMRVGRTKTKFQSYKTIMVWPMLPRGFTEGDKVDIFASVHNLTDKAQTIKVAIKVDNGKVIGGELARTVTIPAKSNAPVYWTFQPQDAGFTQILMSAQCDAGSDASLKRLPVATAAAEQAVAVSDFCKSDISFTVPDRTDLKNSALEMSVSPTLAADMADTLSYLVDYPHGCVEQTMSKFLPAIKVAQILQKAHIINPELDKKLPECVAGGIKRLLELQQPDGGWGWNGSGQTHEMMTPYALYGLLEAEKAGYTIGNETAIKRGLARLEQFIAAMGQPQTADRIYCMYVYSMRNELQPAWWQFISDQKANLSDYATALSLEMAVKAGRKELADALAAALHQRAQKDNNGRVYFRTAGFSRWGDDPHEVTAIALKALVAYDHNDKLIPDILAYFAATKNGNRWNSTKDTAMILYALCDYIATRDAAPAADQFVFTVNGKKPLTLKTTSGLTGKISIPTDQLAIGANHIIFENAPGGAMYRLVFRYWKKGKDIAPIDHGVQVTRRFYLLRDNGQIERELKAGETVPRGAYFMSEVVANRPGVQSMRYVLVENPKLSGAEILPLEDVRFPAGNSSTPFVLREDKLDRVAWHHEEPGQNLVDRCVLHAELAGEFVVSPARVELMYQSDSYGHSGSFHLTVKDAEPSAMK